MPFLQGSKEKDMQSWFHQGWKMSFPLLRGMQTTLRVMQMFIWRCDLGPGLSISRAQEVSSNM